VTGSHRTPDSLATTTTGPCRRGGIRYTKLVSFPERHAPPGLVLPTMARPATFYQYPNERGEAENSLRIAPLLPGAGEGRQMGRRIRCRPSPLLPGAGALLAVSMYLTACDASAPSRQLLPLPDSGAAAHILLDAGRDYPHAPLLRLHEDLSLGMQDGPPQLMFDRIAQIATGADGGLYVAENGSGQVRAFAPDGANLWSFGKKGDGPGEFRFISDLFLQADTVVVVDGEAQRVTRLTPEGTLIEAVSFAAPERRFSPAAATAHGFFVRALRSARASGRPMGTLLVDSTVVSWIPSDHLSLRRFRGGPAGDAAIPVLQHVFAQRYIVSAGFSLSPLWDISGYSAFDGLGKAYVHHGAEYEIWVHDEAGRIRSRLTGPPVENTPITPAHVAEVRRWVEESGDLSSESARILRGRLLRMTDLPTGSHGPVLGRMLVSRAGTIWVERLDLAEEPAYSALRLSSRGAEKWDVISPAGTLRGTVELRAGFFAFTAGDEWIAGVWRDSLGVEYVKRLRLETGTRR
jgi:hypothetical protein